MTEPFRLPTGGRVDRARPVHFSFDGRNYTGLEGDTLAAALLANGIRLVGRSFKWPRSFWKTHYEPAIRRRAGLGRAPADPDPDCYTNRYAHCDVLVVGSGPSGIAAALAASAGGARIILCDEQQELGGSLLAEV